MRAVLLSVVGALGALAFIGLVDLMTDWLWPDGMSGEAFSGSIRTLLILSAAGLVVGVIHHLIPSADEANVFEGITTGRLETLPVPGGLLIAFTSIVGGASLGPEVPTGMLAGGLATSVADRRGWDDVGTRVAVHSSVSSAWSGIFTSPYVSTLMTLELAHVQAAVFWPFLLINVASALIGFSIFYLAGGWAEVIRFLDLPTYQFDLVDLAWAILVGFVAAIGAVLFAMMIRGFRTVAVRFGPRPILRGVVAGVALGLLGMALPLTLFNGAGGLVIITTNAAEIGIGVIIISAVCKLAATAGALAFGFIGGPIFPAMFAGGAMGVALADLFPSMPVAVAVAGGIAALPAAIVPVPFSLAVLSLLIVGSSVQAAPPVLTAAAVSFLLVRGIGEIRPSAATAD